MGKLIIDGNSVFEIDEECIKRRKPSLDCDIEKYFLEEEIKRNEEENRPKMSYQMKNLKQKKRWKFHRFFAVLCVLEESVTTTSAVAEEEKKDNP